MKSANDGVSVQKNEFKNSREALRTKARSWVPTPEYWRTKRRFASGRPVRTELCSRVNFDGQAFKEWFSGSVLLDRAGRPRFFWHGTFGDFESFHECADHRPEHRKDTAGIYFTSLFNYACSYGYNIMQVCLKVRYPYIVKDYSDMGRIITHHRDNLAMRGFDAVVYSLRGTFDEIDEIAVFNADQVLLVRRKHVGGLAVIGGMVVPA